MQRLGSFDVNGGVLVFGGSVATGVTVTFTGSTGTLIIEQPSTFEGQIAGISGSGDVLDLGGFNSHNGDVFETSAVFSNGDTMLTVTDTSDNVSEVLTLVGNYTTANDITWTAESDGNGGAKVVDPPATSPSNASTTSTEINDSFSFTNSDINNTQKMTFTPEGSQYFGAFSLGAVFESDSGATVNYCFAFDNDQIKLAPGQTVTQSYNITASDPQTTAETVSQIVSVSIGGPGNDQFIFQPGVGADTIVNFNPEQDIIELDHFANVQTMQQLSSLITSDAHGDAMIELGHNDSITIPGLTQTYLQAHLESLVRLHH